LTLPEAPTGLRKLVPGAAGKHEAGVEAARADHAGSGRCVA
jgi:hypothetical protein